MRVVADFSIVGGGIAGLTLARALSAGGARVAVIERDTVGRGAAYAAAGMLAPLVEARVEERDVVGFGYEALLGYPEFVAAIESESGMTIDYRTEGTLIVGVDRDDTEAIRHQFREHEELGLPVEWLSGYECRKIEPCLAPGIPGGIFSPRDHQLDNRLLLEALIRSLGSRESVSIIEGAGDGTIESAGSVVRYRAGELEVETGHLVIATGAQGGLLDAVGLTGAIRPVKGQIIRLDQSSIPLLDHVVRSPEMYLVPKSSGAVVLGASSEDRGFDPWITAGAIFELLRAAWECVPGVYELPIVETRVGFRPATIDHAPLLGPTEVDGISVATGYYRHGILFSPHAAEILAAHLLRGDESRWLATFSPERFHAASSERQIG